MLKMKTIVEGIRAMPTDEVTTIVKEAFGEDENLTVVVYADRYSQQAVDITIVNNNNKYLDAVDALLKAALHFSYNPYAESALEGRSVLGEEIFLRPDKGFFVPVDRQIKVLNVKQSSLAVRDARTTEQVLKAAVKYIVDTFRKPVSNGCVKAYVGNTKLFWVSKKADSKNVVKVKDDYYIAEGNKLFVKVLNNLDGSDFKYLSKYSGELRDNYKCVNGTYYHKSLVVPIYTRYNTETNRTGTVAAYILQDQATEQFRSYTRPDGSTVFTNEPLPYAKYWSMAVHGYSDRIESVVEREDLFRKGVVDLYARRKHEETPFLGWELEACYNTKLKDYATETPTAFKKAMEKLVFCKNDGSIRPSGFETVSVPATLDFWKESPLAETLNMMRTAPYSMRSYEHSSCGFHVHVSRTALSVLDLQKLERFMHNPVNASFLNDVAGRGPNTYQNYYPEIFFTKRKEQAKKSNPYISPYRRVDYISATTISILRQYFGISPSTRISAFEKLCMYWYYFMGSATLNRVEVGRVTKRLAQSLKDTLARIDTPTLYYMTDIRDQCDYLLGQFAYAELITENECIRCLEAFVRDIRTTELNSYKNHIRAALEEFFNVSFETEKDEDTSWRAAPRKTVLPVGRVHNYDACRQLKSPLGKGQAGRYDVLNTNNKNTVEFRLFKGTMNPDSVFRYLEFVDAVVRFVPSTSASDSGLSYEAFLKWLSKDSFNVIRYEHLVAFLVAKQYIDRSNVRRRDLPTPVEQDTTNLPPAATTIQQQVGLNCDTVILDVLCNCNSCRHARGEFTPEQWQEIVDNNQEFDGVVNL